jgi:hypothetical protein
VVAHCLAEQISHLDTIIQRCDGSINMTLSLFKKLIHRPKLTEKLLSRPPFRFLFDIIQEVIQVSGFGRGLYNELESNSMNVMVSRETKIQFLMKIIKVLQSHLQVNIIAKPIKIVAGIDPQDTNIVLQLLAIVAKFKPNSTNAVRILLEQLAKEEKGKGIIGILDNSKVRVNNDQRMEGMIMNMSPMESIIESKEEVSYNQSSFDEEFLSTSWQYSPTLSRASSPLTSPLKLPPSSDSQNDVQMILVCCYVCYIFIYFNIFYLFYCLMF